MSTTEHDAWAERDLTIGFADVPAGTGAWEAGLRAAFEYRDLGLAEASDGRFGATHIRVRDGGGELATGWHCHDCDFQFFYVLKGWIEIRTQDGEIVTLRAGDSGNQPALYWHEELACSSDYELFEITSPATFATIHGRDSVLPPREAALDPERRPVYTRDTEDAYVTGAGPRSFFAYRDLGTREMTDDRIHIHTVKVAAGERHDGGTGWHYHTMAQWFFILEGGADLRIETNPRRHLVAGDAVCIGSGPNMRHDVGPIDGHYKLVEMCVPAVYDTIPVEAPQGAAE